MWIFFTGITLFITGGVISELVNFRYRSAITILFSIPGALLTGITAFRVLAGYGTPEITLYMNFPFGATQFAMDHLSALFVSVFSLVYIPVIIYSAGYMKHYNNGRRERLHYISLSLLISSMLLVVTVTNSVMFLVLWELMSLSSFMLVSFENEKRDVYDAAINYLIAMHVGVIFIISVFAYLSFNSGSNSFESFRSILGVRGVKGIILFFIAFIGFGTKAGFFPLHSWLPKAHPAAPSHVSALMSGLMIKTGIYGILRFLSLTGYPSKVTGFTLLAVSSFTALYGILYAMNDRDMKRQLAYSSIENIGIIGIAISAGILGAAYGNSYMSILGYTGAVLHIINHSLFKTLLFLASGSVYINTHTRNMESMGGLFKSIPWTASLFILAAAAITGLPPLNGFISEFFVYFSMLSGTGTTPVLFVTMIAGFSLLAMTGAVAIVAFTKSSGIIFLGTPRNINTEGFHESPVMIAPMVFIALLMIAAAIIPGRLISLTQNVASLLPGSYSLHDTVRIVSLGNRLSVAVALFAAIFAAVLVLRVAAFRRGSAEYYKTWDCGYRQYTPRMQYTASSFSALAVSVTKPFLVRRKIIKSPEGLFPGRSSVNTSNIDIPDFIITRFIKRFIESFFSCISVIQSRTAQQYVIYVILFIIVNFVWIIIIR